MRYVLRRAGFFLLTLWVAVTLNFFLPRMMPGNPAVAMMAKFRGKVTSPEALQSLETIFGVNSGQSLPAQYAHYLGDVFTGNFGTSLFFFPSPVSQVVSAAVFWTLGLVGVTTILAFALGTGIGILAAWRRGGLIDSVAPPLLVITSAIPYFWVGMMFILIFGLKLQWLPWSGGMSLTDTPAWTPSYIGDVVEHALLPALALLITTIGTWTLTMRNNMVTTLAEDYVRMARAKGLRSHRIMLNYAARNAILPNLTGFAMSLGFVV
ncbi:MAG TPA: ABC transporter permease, partial [Streptosporangiaceae bacterium]|nr:ABC transporter permease [Streptosporangiaceae bacterium]